jgi:glycogen(starch) synthase
MRILHLSSEYPPQQIFGLGRYVCDLSRELVQQGHQVRVLTNSLGRPEMDVDDQGVAVHRVEFPPPPKPPGTVAPPMAFNVHLLQRAHALADSLPPSEVVVSHDWLTARAGHLLARRWGVPHIWTVHDLVVGKTFGQLDGPGDTTVYAIEHWAAQTADLVIANSSAIQDELVEKYSATRSRLALIHCGIDPRRFESKQGTDRERAFRSVFAAPDEELVTYVGRLDREKGIDVLLKAFAEVVRGHPGVRLAIAGKGILEEALKDLARQLGIEAQVYWAGYLTGETVIHFYRASDLHVCPSLYEPFGIVAAEAMSAGAPLIASATGGLRDIMESAEVAVSVPPDDHAALARAMLELLKNP